MKNRFAPSPERLIAVSIMLDSARRSKSPLISSMIKLFGMVTTMTTPDKAIWFLLGSTSNAIAWRLGAGSYDDIGYPLAIFGIAIVMLIIRTATK